MNQSQKAGAGSKLIQVMGDYYDGVTEERATEIARQQAQEVIASYSLDATPVAQERVDDFSARLIDVLADEKVLGALADPGFQILLRKAQMSAASTEEEDDYETLARLLGERAKRNIRPIRASIDRAVQVIDSLDESALQGLVMSWVVVRIVPAAGGIESGLDSIEGIWKLLPHDKLPAGGAWLDHLDMLNLIRYSNSGIATLKKLNELFRAQVPGYFSPGLTAEEVEAFDAASREKRADLHFQTIPHELKPDFFRLPFAGVPNLERQLSRFNEDEQREISQLAQNQGRLGQVEESLAAAFDLELSKRPTMALVQKWYDQIPHPPQFTGAGVAVAYVVAKRNSLPVNLGSLEDLLPK